jgi:hypothetical protein
MATSKLTFHIPPDASPDEVLLLVERMSEDPNCRFSSNQALLDLAEAWNIDSRSEIPSLAMALGLLDKNARGVGISEKGLKLQNVKPQIRADLAHFMLYTGWSMERPATNVPFWSYRVVCDYFWERSPLDILQTVAILVEEVINRSERIFAGVNGYSSGAVSFSDKSIRGVRKWLEALRPPVIEGNTFTRRHFCPPELLLLVLGYVARQTDAEIDIDLLLTTERREWLCRLCLLDPTALDRALDWMLPLYKEVVEPGTRTGAYGRFVRLRKMPELSDLRAER